jgi:hypothetical protein
MKEIIAKKLKERKLQGHQYKQEREANKAWKEIKKAIQ